MRISNCRSCHAAIIWTETEKGKKMPVDAEPALNGNIDLWTSGDKVTAAYTAMDAGTKRYISHFVTCPNADKHRKPKTPS
jgi:hypothetical protein